MKLIAFALVAFGAVITPGPNMMYLVSRYISYGGVLSVHMAELRKFVAKPLKRSSAQPKPLHTFDYIELRFGMRSNSLTPLT